VEALLAALREGMGAEAVGLFDDDRGQLRAASAPAHPSFWEAFEGLGCVDVDWPSWYETLRARKRVEIACTCGRAHRLFGYLIHDRWVLLLVASATLAPGAAGVASSALKVLADTLPPARDRKRDAPHPEGEPAGGAGPPLWWVRKVRN
jgi:hypothetical protein